MHKILVSTSSLLAAAFIFSTGASAAQDRMAAVEECVAQAQQQVADPTGARSSSVQTARTQVYSACMKKKGLRP